MQLSIKMTAQLRNSHKMEDNLYMPNSIKTYTQKFFNRFYKYVAMNVTQKQKLMEDYQKRVIAEKEILDANIEKLTKFCTEGTKPYKNLIPAEKADLKTQLSAMNVYSKALERRIARFPKEETTKTED